MSIAFLNTAPAPHDPAKVLEELLEAQDQSFVLGLKFNLPLHEVQAIHKMHLNPRDRLLHVIIAFLKQVEPTLTWRVIVDALNNPIVNMPVLAKRVERAHFPESTFTGTVVHDDLYTWCTIISYNSF